MHSFFAYTNLANPGLHVWREGTSLKLYLRPVSRPAGPGWVEFRCHLNPATQRACAVHAVLLRAATARPASSRRTSISVNCHVLPPDSSRPPSGSPQGASRVVLEDPRLQHADVAPRAPDFPIAFSARGNVFVGPRDG